jgi:hypothetical protein
MRARTVPSTILLALLAAAPAMAGFAGTDVFLPMAGRQAGVHPSNWYTTVWIHNPGGAAVTARVWFLERNTANPSPPWVDVAVAGGDTEKLENVVEEYFHLAVFGALRVTAPAKLVVTSRVYSKGAGLDEGDSVGQEFAGVPASFAIGAGERGQILGVYQTQPAAESEFRFNFGFVETTGHIATVRVTAYDGNGAQQGSKDFQVREWSQRQVAFKDHFPDVSTENARLEVEVVGGDGEVIAYGSGIANGSQDPTTFEMSYADSLLGIAGVQHDATLAGDGTASAPLGIAPSSSVGQVLITADPGDPDTVTASGVPGAVRWLGLDYKKVWSFLGEGAVLFGAAGGGLGHDAAQLHWDDGANRLGIGVPTPAQCLDVNGNIRMPATGATAGALMLGDTRFLHAFGSANTFLGWNAGNFALTGNSNTAAGSAAMLALTSGNANTAVGQRALADNTSGGLNTAVGAFALQHNLTADGNTAVGAEALRASDTGHSNTALGMNTMIATTSGYNNTAVGRGSMVTNTTGFNNVAVGSGTLASSAAADGNTALGVSAMQKTTSGGNNVAVGFTALYSNTTGLSNTAVGATALYKNDTASNGTAVGYKALNNNATGARNTAVGSLALTKSSTGHANTALGADSLRENLSGGGNVAVGSLSLSANTMGSNNTGCGSGTLLGNTEGANNTAAGANAMYENVGGVQNAAFGSMSLHGNVHGSYNAAFGAGALAGNPSGERNTAVGADAMRNSASGSDSTVLGFQAGYSASGNANVLIGARAGFNETASNRLHIANTDSSTLIYGQFDSRRVGIDTTGPTATLDVNGGLRVRNLGSAGVVPVAADANGVLVLATPSDARLKRDVAPLGASVDVLAALAGLRGVSYSWDTAQARVRSYGDRREIGLLAQDVEAVLPEVVSTGLDGYKSVDYARLTALLVEVAKAQQSRIDALEAEVAALRR